MQPKYDNVFVWFGAFHIMFRYSSAVGYLMDGSGAVNVLMESGALTKGSLSAFLSGKHYNQATKIHLLLATAMQNQHLDLFLQLEEANDAYVHLVETLKTTQSSPSPEKMKYLEDTDEYTEFTRSYESFCGYTRASKHGVNTQFWRNYIDMVDIYMLFNRAV